MSALLARELFSVVFERVLDSLGDVLESFLNSLDGVPNGSGESLGTITFTTLGSTAVPTTHDGKFVLEGAADGLTLGAKVVVAGGEVVAGTAVGVVKGAADGLEKVVDKVTEGI